MAATGRDLGESERHATIARTRYGRTTGGSGALGNVLRELKRSRIVCRVAHRRVGLPAPLPKPSSVRNTY